MPTYSFLDVNATLRAPNGVVSLGAGAGSAEEGITTAMAEDKNTQTTGADGKVMNSLHAANKGTITVRLLKTSPANAQLARMYAEQRQSSANWGQNTIVVSDTARGDFITAAECAFKKFPDIVYSKDGNMNEWTFDAGDIDQVLGGG